MTGNRRKRRCKGCKDYFRPLEDDSDFICWCSVRCKESIWKKSLLKSKTDREKAAKREHNERKRDLKPLSHWLRLTQAVFNEYIRKRDKDLPCISCGTTKPVQYCASHFRTRGAAGHLRFDERNVHKACNKRCNLELSGNIAGYRPGLIEKIGLKAVEGLENDNSTKKWTREELEELRKKYRKKIKELIVDH